ncbi:hypothetical protein PL9631_1030058 [Planktothrix paucivesiculata PCC 9631]|uniref:Uncharacterized protein n=1 Tax=Planktothrix paucivesiculata PCC 9631 TaxID=671071 RepID=A0A7Z9DUQ3_9CYAN|nr:hypothetical protein PL9631_1030058 [Planktothrix paucivesiculata PCC 9631]
MLKIAKPGKSSNQNENTDFIKIKERKKLNNQDLCYSLSLVVA